MSFWMIDLSKAFAGVSLTVAFGLFGRTLSANVQLTVDRRPNRKLISSWHHQDPVINLIKMNSRQLPSTPSIWESLFIDGLRHSTLANNEEFEESFWATEVSAQSFSSQITIETL